MSASKHKQYRVSTKMYSAKLLELSKLVDVTSKYLYQLLFRCKADSYESALRKACYKITHFRSNKKLIFPVNFQKLVRRKTQFINDIYQTKGLTAIPHCKYRHIDCKELSNDNMKVLANFPTNKFIADYAVVGEQDEEGIVVYMLITITGEKTTRHKAYYQRIKDIKARPKLTYHSSNVIETFKYLPDNGVKLKWTAI